MYKTVSKNMQNHIHSPKKKRGSAQEFKEEEKRLIAQLTTLSNTKSVYADEVEIYNLYCELVNIMTFHNELYPLKDGYVKYINDKIKECRIIPTVNKIEKDKKIRLNERNTIYIECTSCKRIKKKHHSGDLNELYEKLICESCNSRYPNIYRDTEKVLCEDDYFVNARFDDKNQLII